MKESTRNFRKIIGSNRGEMLLESIISIMVFSILILGVTFMVDTALRITKSAVKVANEQTETMNRLVLHQYEPSPAAGTPWGSGSLTYTLAVSTNTISPVPTTVPVPLYDGNTCFYAGNQMVAFIPAGDIED